MKTLEKGLAKRIGIAGLLPLLLTAVGASAKGTNFGHGPERPIFLGEPGKVALGCTDGWAMIEVGLAVNDAKQTFRIALAPEALKATAEEFVRLPSPGVNVTCSLSSGMNCERTVAEIATYFGRLPSMSAWLDLGLGNWRTYRFKLRVLNEGAEKAAFCEPDEKRKNTE